MCHLVWLAHILIGQYIHVIGIILLRQSKVKSSSPTLHIILFACNKSVVCCDLEIYCQDNLRSLYYKLVKLSCVCSLYLDIGLYIFIEKHLI